MKVKAAPAVAPLGELTLKCVAGAGGVTCIFALLVIRLLPVSVAVTVWAPCDRKVTPLLKVWEPLSVLVKV